MKKKPKKFLDIIDELVSWNSKKNNTKKETPKSSKPYNWHEVYNNHIYNNQKKQKNKPRNSSNKSPKNINTWFDIPFDENNTNKNTVKKLKKPKKTIYKKEKNPKPEESINWTNLMKDIGLVLGGAVLGGLAASLLAEDENENIKIPEGKYKILDTAEIHSYLNYSLYNAKKRLIIETSRLRGYVLKDYVKQLDALLNKGVNVTILYGYVNGRNGTEVIDQEARTILKELRKTYPNKLFVNNLPELFNWIKKTYPKKYKKIQSFKGTHSNLLILDDKAVLLGSYNFFAFKFPSKKYASEKGVWIDDPEEVKKIYKKLVSTYCLNSIPELFTIL